MTGAQVSTQPSAASRWVSISIGAGLVAACAVVYAPVRHHDFVNFDDAQYVTANAAVSGGLSGRAVRWAFSAWHAGNWHPLTWLSHMLDAELFGIAAGGHHVTSVVLHAANAVLLFALLRRMTGRRWRSAFVAGLFALHPLHVESVAWIAERKDVLSTLFLLLTLHAYVGYVRSPRRMRYALVLVLFALGLMAKPTLVTLPFVLLLLDFWPLGRADEPSAWRRLILEKLPLLALAGVSGVVTLLAQQRAGAVQGLDALPLGRRLATAVVAYMAYLGATLWPARLAAIYPYPAPPPIALVLAALALLVAISIAAVRAARPGPYLPVGWFWYLGTLVPVIGLVQVGSQPLADRYTYVPLVGLFLIVAWGIPDLLGGWRHRRLVLTAAAVAALAASAMTARAQVRHWRDSVTLWEHALAVTEENYRAEANLGHALAREGRLDDAVAHYRAALRIKPDFAEAHNNLGLALADEGKAGEAIAHYSEAVRVRPDYLEAHNNLGVALTSEGRSAEAVREFSEAVRIDPGVAVSRNNLGVALAREGKLDEAASEFAQALRLEPGYAEARTNLAVAHNGIGAALADRGRLDGAFDHYVQALRLQPGLADAHANLARVLVARGRSDEAILELLEAIRFQPGDPDLHYDLAVLLIRAGRTREAAVHLRAALELLPTHEAARRALDALGRTHGGGG